MESVGIGKFCDFSMNSGFLSHSVLGMYTVIDDMSSGKPWAQGLQLLYLDSFVAPSGTISQLTALMCLVWNLVFRKIFIPQSGINYTPRFHVLNLQEGLSH